MPYASRLNDMIKKSGMTAKEIADKCTENGQAVTASYISILRNDKNQRIPSPEVSAALAAAMGQDENLLVVEGAFDSAHPIIQKAINNISINMALQMQIMTGGKVTPELYHTAKQLAAAMPVAESIIELAKEPDMNQLNSNTDKNYSFEEHGNQLNFNLVNDNSLEVKDDAMFPMICEGDSVKLRQVSKYYSGDIIAFYIKEEQDMQLRQYQELEDGTKLLIPFCAEYERIVYEDDKILPLGKVTAVQKPVE